MCEFHAPHARTGDITDFDHIEFKYTKQTEQERDGKIIKVPEEKRYVWAVECKAKEGKKQNVVKNTELSSKAMRIQKQRTKVETWVIFAPQRPLDDIATDLFKDDSMCRFHISIWDPSNFECKKVFALLGESVWEKFFPGEKCPTTSPQEIQELLSRIGEEGKSKRHSYEEKMAGTPPEAQIEISGRISANADIFPKIHRFLDALNTLIERDFTVAKDVYYKGAWKVGLGYYKFEKDELSYSTFPISPESNDVQIKELSEDLVKKFIAEKRGFTSHFTSNPIEERPEEYALEIVKSQTSKIIENKLLHHEGNTFLASEYLIAFIDKFSKQLGLAKKQSYSLEEIENAYRKHLPLWIEEAATLMVAKGINGKKKIADCLLIDRYSGIRPHFDPDFIISQIISDADRESILKKVQGRMQDKNVVVQDWPIGSRRMPVGIFEDYIADLKKRGVKEINRLYKPKDFSRMPGGGWVWNAFSKEAAEHNLRVLFEHFPGALDTLLTNNFPALKSQLDGKKLFIYFENLKDKYVTAADGPTYGVITAKPSDPNDNKIEFITADEAKVFDDGFRREVEFKGKKYKTQSIRHSVLDFLYEYAPLMDLLYETLKNLSEDYFEKLAKKKT